MLKKKSRNRGIKKKEINIKNKDKLKETNNYFFKSAKIIESGTSRWFHKKYSKKAETRFARNVVNITMKTIFWILKMLKRIVVS